MSHGIQMHYLEIIDRLNNASKCPHFTHAEIAASGGEGLRLFQAISKKIYDNIEAENIANSPASKDFLAHRGGILLWQSGGASIIAQIYHSGDEDKSLLWTPRNILFVVVRGKATVELFSPQPEVQNDLFVMGSELSRLGSWTLEEGHGILQPKDQIMKVTPNAGYSPIVTIGFYGKALDILDWSYDNQCRSCRVMQSRQEDTDLQQTMRNFVDFFGDEGSAEKELLTAIRLLSEHSNYLVRWSALKILWLNPGCDLEVLRRVASDPHPEIHLLLPELEEMVRETA